MYSIKKGNSIQLLNELQPGSVDLIFTDPPYKLIGGGCKKSMMRLRDADPESAFTTSGEVFRTPTPEFKEWLPGVYRALKDDAYAFIMINDVNLRVLWNAAEDAGFKFCQLLVMGKTHAVPSSYFFKSCEFILMFRKGAYTKFEKYGQRSYIEVKTAKGKEKIHPTEKPTELIKPILEACSKPGDLILDPFMGSASTGVAALELGRRFIGFEIDPIFYERCSTRLYETFEKIMMDI